MDIIYIYGTGLTAPLAGQARVGQPTKELNRMASSAPRTGEHEFAQVQNPGPNTESGAVSESKKRKEKTNPILWPVFLGPIKRHMSLTGPGAHEELPYTYQFSVFSENRLG